MSYDKQARALKRHHDQREVRRQVSIKQALHHEQASVPGRFRKQAAMDCGVPGCFACANPRRVWKLVTVAEKRSQVALEHDLRHELGE